MTFHYSVVGRITGCWINPFQVISNDVVLPCCGCIFPTYIETTHRDLYIIEVNKCHKNEGVAAILTASVDSHNLKARIKYLPRILLKRVSSEITKRFGLIGMFRGQLGNHI